MDTKEFKVIQLPLATVVFVQNNIPLDYSYGLDKNAQNTVINIIPPSELKEEDQYTVDISVSIKRDGKTYFLNKI